MERVILGSDGLKTYDGYRILYCIEEDWPTFRADVRTLFSEYLPRFGVQSDLCGLESVDSSVSGSQWHGGRSFLLARPKCTLFGGPMKLVHVVWRLLKARRTDYCAIQIRDMPVAAFFAVVISRLKDRPLIYWMSYAIPESQIELARERGLGRGIYYLVPLIKGTVGKFLLYRFVLPRSRHIFVQSARMAADLRKRSVPAFKMTAVPMGVDLERADPAKVVPIEDPFIDGKRVVVYLGTLHRSRRIELLVEMILLTAKKIENVVLVVVGDIDEAAHREWLKDYAVRRGAAGLVQWKGWQTVDAAWGYLMRAEVGLSPFPRSFELDSCSPTKTIEYLAFGVPVVGNNQPEQETVIRQSRGGFCVEWSAQAFSDAVVRLLDDKELRLSMGREGAAFVARNRGYDRIAATVAEKYRELFGPPGSNASEKL